MWLCFPMVPNGKSTKDGEWIQGICVILCLVRWGNPSNWDTTSVKLLCQSVSIVCRPVCSVENCHFWNKPILGWTHPVLGVCLSNALLCTYIRIYECNANDKRSNNHSSNSDSHHPYKLNSNVDNFHHAVSRIFYKYSRWKPPDTG